MLRRITVSITKDLIISLQIWIDISRDACMLWDVHACMLRWDVHSCMLRWDVHVCMLRWDVHACMLQNLSENVPVTQWHPKKRYMPLEQSMPRSGLCIIDKRLLDCNLWRVACIRSARNEYCLGLEIFWVTNFFVALNQCTTQRFAPLAVVAWLHPILKLLSMTASIFLAFMPLYENDNRLGMYFSMTL